MNAPGHPHNGSNSPEIREITCKQAMARVYEYLDGELDAISHDEVRAHLEKCRRCYPHFDFERMFLDYVHEVGAREAKRPGLEDRVRTLLANAAG
jgi:anti-sigma factor (TIGR02949 family)